MTDLAGKIILITGAAGAIGSAVAAAVKSAGGICLATDLKSGGGIEALDVTSEADWQRTAAGIENKHGRLDGLVNAAGIVALGSVEALDFAVWRRVLSVNLDGAFLGCKYSFPLLRKRGAIVNISSVSGLVGGHNLAAYNASKAACRCFPNRWLSMARASRRRCAATPSARPSSRVRWWRRLCRARAIPKRRGQNCRAIFPWVGSASRRRSRSCVSTFCRMRPPSSPARTYRSMAGLPRNRNADSKSGHRFCVGPRDQRSAQLPISAVTCAATERDRPSKS